MISIDARYTHCDTGWVFWNGNSDDVNLNNSYWDVEADQAYFMKDGDNTTGGGSTGYNNIVMTSSNYSEFGISNQTFYGPFTKWMKTGDATDNWGQYSGEYVHQMRYGMNVGASYLMGSRVYFVWNFIQELSMCRG